MPNWCEGVMKLRGAKEDILKFLEEGLEGSYKDSKIEIDEFGEEINIIHIHWIKNTNRGFLDEQTVYIPEKEDPVVLTLHIRQAWDFSTDQFLGIAKTFNLDIRLFGWERGALFSREILIMNGKRVKECKYFYETPEKWEWEVPFSELGG